MEEGRVVPKGQVGFVDSPVESPKRPWGRLAPVAHRGWWIAGGLVLQVVGVAMPVLYLTQKAKHENVGGSITLPTVRLAWHNSLHNRTGLALLIAGAVLVVIGAILLARPFVKSLPLLLAA
ncbi:MAG: hypothetical protein JOZ73_06780, partial [Solirubrobacterales bacterium]|nr:hypothetical protein [Solirubrobacterales bacterium]